MNKKNGKKMVIISLDLSLTRSTPHPIYFIWNQHAIHNRRLVVYGCYAKEQRTLRSSSCTPKRKHWNVLATILFSHCGWNEKKLDYDNMASYLVFYNFLTAGFWIILFSFCIWFRSFLSQIHCNLLRVIFSFVFFFQPQLLFAYLAC